MCTNPISVINYKRYVPVCSGTKLLNFVPCGHCSECLDQRGNEFSLRTYYQALDCISHGGYCLLDCLTYSDEYLPHISDFIDIPSYLDFKCFNRDHLHKFHSSLLKAIKRIGYDPHGAYKYAVCGEYGTDDRYTKRPHYHIMFFVYAPIDSVTFSTLVSNCWFYGRTDGFVYKGKSYLDYMTFRNVNDSLLRISKYVAKYLVKSDKLINLCHRRVMRLIYYATGKYKYTRLDYNERLLYRNLARYHKPFRNQSKGYGLFALQCIDLDFILNTGSIYYTLDRKYNFPIPMYYYRKLFFTVENTPFGKQFVSNSLYSVYYKKMLDKRLEFFRKKVVMLEKSFDFPIFDYQIEKFVKYYNLFYGRVQNDCQLHYNHYGSNILFDLTQNGFYSFLHPKYNLGCLSVNDLTKYKPVKVISYEDFVKNFLFDEKLCSDFTGFSRLLFYFFQSLDQYGKNKDSVYWEKYRLKNQVNYVS